MNLEDFDKMIDYVFNNGVAQIELVVTKIGEKDHQFTIKTVEPTTGKYICKDSMGYSMQECMDDWNRRQ